MLCSLGNIDGNFLFTGVSVFDNSEVLSGRPYSGCAILWRSDISADIRVIETNSRRMCALRIFKIIVYKCVYAL